MKKRTYIILVLFLIISSLCVCALAYALGALYIPSHTLATDAAASTPQFKTVIIDAGHGGEDGGTSSASGLVEKDVNLDISKKLCDMLRASGINVIMTREEDKLLYDRNVDFHGRKKKLDLAARLAIAETTPDAIFLSIHMNSFTDPKYSGMQVWYSPNHLLSEKLAERIREENRKLLQPDNNRKTTRATSSINLLYNAKCPAVLIECGFLSNPTDAERFETEEYRQKVAFVIFCSVMDFLIENSSSS